MHKKNIKAIGNGQLTTSHELTAEIQHLVQFWRTKILSKRPELGVMRGRYETIKTTILNINGCSGPRWDQSYLETLPESLSAFFCNAPSLSRFDTARMHRIERRLAESR